MRQKIETSKGGFFAKPDISYWSEVKQIDLKLFEIHLITSDGKHKVVNLTNLTDDNLKMVKEFVATVKKNTGL